MYVFSLSAILIVLGLLLSGCASTSQPADCNKLIESNKYKKEQAWCSVPYLHKEAGHDIVSIEKNEHLRKKMDLSKNGYMYALAAALVLQQQERDVLFNFSSRPRLWEVPGFRMLENDTKTESDFAATAFILYKKDEYAGENRYICSGKNKEDASEKVESVIIAFQGSNSIKDWLLQNIYPFVPLQFDEARLYAKLVYQNEEVACLRREGIKLVAVGFSLGGSTAAHVRRHPGMRYKADKGGYDNNYSPVQTASRICKESEPAGCKPIIDEVWAFNSSPRMGMAYSPKSPPVNRNSKNSRNAVYNRKITRNEPVPGVHLLAEKQEFLNWPFFRFREKQLGAAPENTVTDFDLIKSSSAFSAHARWVLTREIFHYADLHMSLYAGDGYVSGESEPMEILKSQDAANCICGHMK